MTPNQYYTAPPQRIFDEIKAAAMKVWSKYDDLGGYRTEKINRIKDISNVQDNAWYMVAMFDAGNQRELMSLVSDEAREMIIDAMNT